MIAIERASPQDLDAIHRLLRDHRLPLDGLGDHLAATLVARDGGAIVGSAALELYADGALLRSVAVAPELQRSGLGRRLMDEALTMARAQGAPAVYLLTTTAEAYFPKFGFERIERKDVPPGVQTSIEFTSACPASAIVMRKRISP